MGPKGSKRAPGGTAPGGSRFGRPDDGSISALGKPDLRGSTIMPPLRHLRQEGTMGKQMWQAAVGEGVKVVRMVRTKNDWDINAGWFKQTHTDGCLSASRKWARATTQRAHLLWPSWPVLSALQVP